MDVFCALQVIISEASRSPALFVVEASHCFQLLLQRTERIPMLTICVAYAASEPSTKVSNNEPLFFLRMGLATPIDYDLAT